MALQRGPLFSPPPLAASCLSLHDTLQGPHPLVHALTSQAAARPEGKLPKYKELQNRVLHAFPPLPLQPSPARPLPPSLRSQTQHASPPFHSLRSRALLCLALAPHVCLLAPALRHRARPPHLHTTPCERGSAGPLSHARSWTEPKKGVSPCEGQARTCLSVALPAASVVAPAPVLEGFAPCAAPPCFSARCRRCGMRSGSSPQRGPACGRHTLFALSRFSGWRQQALRRAAPALVVRQVGWVEVP